jgi:beta-glucanase (GH16 family)
MKNHALFAVSLVSVLLGAAAGRSEEASDRLPSLPEGKTWKLIWHDEFDGAQIDETKWDIRDNVKRKEKGVFMREAMALDGQGHLVGTIRKRGDIYSIGGIRTRGKFEHRFGYYVARFQFHSQPGHWPAFWLSGAGVTTVGNEGRDGTEIDIMEKPWLDDRMQHTLHWDGYAEHHKTASHRFTFPGQMQGWHTYSVWWKPEEYIFYADGQETWRTKAGGVCQVPLGIIVSDEVGRWSGDSEEANYPDSYKVDYVRVYDLVDTPTASPSGK